MNMIQSDTVPAAMELPQTANQNHRPARARSLFPDDAHALIRHVAHAPSTAGKARRGEWILSFPRRTPQFIEPLMGWTGGDDPLAHVELRFPTLAAAISYAERQHLPYEVAAQERTTHFNGSERGTTITREQAFHDALSAYLSTDWLQTHYGRGCPSSVVDLDRALLNPAAVFSTPDDVVADPDLAIELKRAILHRWAWDEYLLELAEGEAMPCGQAPSLLAEIRQALLRLESADIGAAADPPTQAIAA
jgi:hypothetical protein